MPISKTKNLLGQLAQLERTVGEFSFEELSAYEAKVLKATFNSFRTSLENHIYDDKEEEIYLNEKEVVSTKDQDISQRQFIAHVSHEIRTPLNSIIGYSNLLNDEELTEDQHRKVASIQFASNSLLKIINEVLDYSKICSGNSTFESIDFNLHSLLKDVMFLCETLVVDKKLELLLEIDENVPKIITGDPSKLSQVLLNLLGNSVKFVDQGFVKLEVFAKEIFKDNCVLEFSVLDTGIGISKEKIEKIFNRYTQADNNTSEKYGGTGLGLSITKEIIEKLNGEIEIDSVENKGTNVTFRMPYSYGIDKVLKAMHTKKNTKNEKRKLLEGTEIMIFEDNKMNLRLIEEQLMKLGCKVYTDITIDESLKVLATNKIDLILMDLKMPNQNGFEVSKIIRSHENILINTTPIVAFSADFTEEDSMDCKAIGINDFLLKPYTLNDLISIVKKNKKIKTDEADFALILQRPMIEQKETTVVNLENLLQDCFGELEMLNELVKLFKINAIEFIGNVKVHLKTENLMEIALSAHKLKAGLAMIKADGMRKLMVELENSCKTNQPEKVKALYETFLKDYPILEKNLFDAIEVLNKK